MYDISGFQKQDKLKKYADLFDIERDSKETTTEFKNRLRSAKDFIVTEQSIKNVQVNPNNMSLQDLKYEVIDYDNHLQEYLTKQKVKYRKFEKGTTVQADRLFRKIKIINNNNLPINFCDNHGNIWTVKR